MMRDYFIFSSVFMVTLLSCAGIALPYPVLAPLFMDGQLNGLNSFMSFSPEILLGMALAIYPLGIVIGGSFIGALSDSYGRKKVLILTLLISIIGYVITAYAIVSEDYMLFILARFFTGLCEGNISIARAIALDLGKTIDKTRAMSLISAAGFLGWLIGPLSGGYLAEYGSDTPFIAAAIAIFVCMLFVIVFIKETHQVKNTQNFMTLLRTNNSLHLLQLPNIKRIFIFQFIFTMGLNAFYEFYPVWLVTNRNAMPSDIGQITAIMTISMTLASLLLVTRLKNTFGMHAMLITSLVLTALLMFLLPLTDTNIMISLFALTGITIAIYNGLLPVFASDINPDTGNGALMGLLTVTFCIANVVISLLGSLVLKSNPTFPLYLGSVLVMLSALLLGRFLSTRNHLKLKTA